jgi:hypothetical protein
MVFLDEPERLIADELALVNDATFYSISAVADWTTVATKNITLAKQLIVMIKANFHSYLSSGSNYWNGRIKIDGTPLWTLGGTYSPNLGNDYLTPDIYVLLTAGAHAITFDAATWALGTNGAVGVSFIFIAQLNFNDALSGGPWDSGGVSVPAGVQTTLLNQNVTIPAGRSTPIGPIANYSLFIFVVAKDAGASPVRQTHMKNSGDSNDASKINVTLFVNDAQVNFNARTNDDADERVDNPSYGTGAKGYYVYRASVNQALNIKVKAYDSDGATVECYVTAFLCPWISPGVDYQPVTFDFSDGSTFYAMLEPLYENAATKSSKIGKARFKSFGDATDFYSVASGINILTHSYTFDVVKVATSEWHVVSTTYICISYVGVDMR